MFEQVVGSGANVFVIILAVLFGFVNALAYVDMKKVESEQKDKKQGD